MLTSVLPARTATRPLSTLPGKSAMIGFYLVAGWTCTYAKAKVSSHGTSQLHLKMLEERVTRNDGLRTFRAWAAEAGVHLCRTAGQLCLHAMLWRSASSALPQYDDAVRY